MRLLHCLLRLMGQKLGDPIREFRTVPPSPDTHAVDTEKFCRRPVAAKQKPEQPVMPSAGQFPLEARRGY
jgi:hypothetical protein